MATNKTGMFAASMALLAASAWADLEGQGPDAWRVSGVAADDVLKARMGPGTDYAVIATFAPGERGLQQVTCVPLVPQATWMQMTQSQRSALPQPWCLVRSKGSGRSGWVARRYPERDAAAASGGANTAASAPHVQEAAKPCGTPNCSGTHVVAAGSMRSRKAHTDVTHTDRARFVQAKGFAPVDQWPGTASAKGEDFHSEARFPDVGKSATLPDAHLAAITRALLAFDFEESTEPWMAPPRQTPVARAITLRQANRSTHAQSPTMQICP
ncbi:MAG: hypothetical protein WCZ18_10345 [Ottowia sp.]|nr:hypothetical protein [Ottowia sp.]